MMFEQQYERLRRKLIEVIILVLGILTGYTYSLF